MSEPIKPEDVIDAKKKTLPSEVIDSFNFLIARNWNGRSATVLQKDVCDEIVRRMGLDGGTRERIYENHWLDVEAIYRATGWVVTYDKPGYCETGEPYFKFSKKP